MPFLFLHIYNVVQNSDGTYTITVKDGNAYKNLETGKVVLFSAKEMGTDTDIALKVQNITKDGQGRLIIKAGKPAKASYAVKIGDVIEITFGNRPVKVRVLSIDEPKGKDVARELFEILEG